VSTREKILALTISLAVVLFTFYLAVDKLFLSQRDRLNGQRTSLRHKIDAANQAMKDYEKQVAKLPDLLAKTFGSDENVASERVRARLVNLLKASGMKTDISLTPQSSAKVRSPRGDIAGNEVTWQVVTEGKLDQLIDFVYLLDNEPYLHRIESLSLTPRSGSGTIEMRLRFLSFVPAKRHGKDVPPGAVAEQPPSERLDSPRRKLYEVIASRDAFRPYLRYQAPPVAVRPAPPVGPRPTVVHAPTAPPEKVVSLAMWAGRQEVYVRNQSTGEIRVLKPGQTLAGGKIVMIDYRRLPMPGEPQMLSTSRVILQKGGSYWAIELGQDTTIAHRMPEDQLPQALTGNGKVD